jgi:hypothetical protein
VKDGDLNPSASAANANTDISFLEAKGARHAWPLNSNVLIEYFKLQSFFTGLFSLELNPSVVMKLVKQNHFGHCTRKIRIYGH